MSRAVSWAAPMDKYLALPTAEPFAIEKASQKVVLLVAQLVVRTEYEKVEMMVAYLNGWQVDLKVADWAGCLAESKDRIAAGLVE